VVLPSHIKRGVSPFIFLPERAFLQKETLCEQEHERPPSRVFLHAEPSFSFSLYDAAKEQRRKSIPHTAERAFLPLLKRGTMRQRQALRSGRSRKSEPLLKDKGEQSTYMQRYSEQEMRLRSSDRTIR